LPRVVANASNTVALTPGNLVAALSDLERLPRWDRSLLGGGRGVRRGSVAGAALLLLTPEKAFNRRRAAAHRIRHAALRAVRAESGRGSCHEPRRPMGPAPPALLFAPVAVYGGYFGAGMGAWMLLAILSVSRPGDSVRST